MSSIEHGEIMNQVPDIAVFNSALTYTKPEEIVKEICLLESGAKLVIFGQPTMASYEWLLIVDGNISHSNDGFGSIDAALIKGLKVFLSHMEGDER